MKFRIKYDISDITGSYTNEVYMGMLSEQSYMFLLIGSQNLSLVATDSREY